MPGAPLRRLKRQEQEAAKKLAAYNADVVAGIADLTPAEKSKRLQAIARAQARAARQDAKDAEAAKVRPPKLSSHKPKLSEAHKAVVDAYFKNGCVSKKRALIDAGYSPNTAAGTASAIFYRDDVIEEIARRRARHEKRSEVTEARIIEEMAKIAFARAGDLLEVNEDGSAAVDYNYLTSDQKAAITEIKTEMVMTRVGEGEDATLVPTPKTFVKFASKQAALDSLARIKGIAKPEKIEISGALNLADRIQAARKRLQTKEG